MKKYTASLLVTACTSAGVASELTHEKRDLSGWGGWGRPPQWSSHLSHVGENTGDSDKGSSSKSSKGSDDDVPQWGGWGPGTHWMSNSSGKSGKGSSGKSGKGSSGKSGKGSSGKSGKGSGKSSKGSSSKSSKGSSSKSSKADPKFIWVWVPDEPKHGWSDGWSGAESSGKPGKWNVSSGKSGKGGYGGVSGKSGKGSYIEGSGKSGKVSYSGGSDKSGKGSNSGDGGWGGGVSSGKSGKGSYGHGDDSWGGESSTNWSDDNWAPGWGGLEDDYEIIKPSSDDSVGDSTDDDHLATGLEMDGHTGYYKPNPDGTNWSDDDWAPGWGGLEDDYEIIKPSSDDGVGAHTDDDRLASTQLRRALKAAIS